MLFIENLEAGMEYKCQICCTKRTFDMASVLLIVMFYCQQGGQSSRRCEVSEDGKDPHNSVVFSLKNQVGGLARALQVFQVMFKCFFASLRRIISLLAEVSLYLQVHLLNYSTYVYLNQSLYSIYILKLLRLYRHSPIGPI